MASCSCVSLAVLVVILGVLFALSNEPILQSILPHIGPEEFTPYTMKTIYGPTLSGIVFKVFLGLLETPVIGNALLSVFMREQQTTLRRFAAGLEYWPMFYPIEELDQQQLEKHVELAEKEDKSALQSLRNEKNPYKTSSDYIQSYRTGSSDPVQVVQSILAEIQSTQGEGNLNAFSQVHEEDVLLQARESKARWERGQPLSEIDGVPIAVKDEVDVKGYITTMGTSFLGKGKPVCSDDCIVVARLRAAGAIIVGKTNMHEIGIGTTGHNVNGLARNPFDLSRYTGGSSSGSAAAVGAGIVPIAIGADGGGSIRIPAALCGVFGLKATYARVPCEAHMAWSVVHVGPIASSIEDVALVYKIIAPEHNYMPFNGVPVPHLEGVQKSLSGLKVGIYKPWVEDADPDVHEAFQSTLKILEKMGVDVVQISIPNLEMIGFAHPLTILAEMAVYTDEFLGDYNSLSVDTRVNLALAKWFGSRDYVGAQKIRAYAWDLMQHVFEDVDFVLTPTTGTVAPPINPDTLDTGETNWVLTSKLMRFVMLTNFLGNPSLAFPIGYNPQGLPISGQVIGRHWDDALAVRVAARITEEIALRKP